MQKIERAPDNRKRTLQEVNREFSEFHPICVVVEGTNKTTGFNYKFGFIFEHPDGPYIKIDSEDRRDFLLKGTEREAQDALIELSETMRERTGGYYNIHPFYGAVYGTRLTPVAPGFMKDLARPDEGLGTIIFLNDFGDRFDEGLTKIAIEIGMTVEFPSEKAEKFREYLRAQNPSSNQRSRDKAIVNKLGDRWDTENKAFNGRKTQPHAMDLTVDNIVKVMGYLETNAGISDIVVSYTY